MQTIDLIKRPIPLSSAWVMKASSHKMDAPNFTCISISLLHYDLPQALQAYFIRSKRAQALEYATALCSRSAFPIFTNKEILLCKLPFLDFLHKSYSLYSSLLKSLSKNKPLPASMWLLSNFSNSSLKNRLTI